MRGTAWWTFAPTVLGLLLASVTTAERLPISVYTVADGLAGDSVGALAEDGSGYLWVGTPEGLSRFDGESFRTYGRADGLPGVGVGELLADRTGTLWLISGDQVARLLDRRDEEGRLFQTCAVIGDEPEATLFELFEDSAGRLWLTAGRCLYLYQRERDRFEQVHLGISWPPGILPWLVGMAEGRDGSLWIRGTLGLARRLPSGRTLVYPLSDTRADENDSLIDVDASGRVWFACRSVMAFLPEPAAEADRGYRLLPRAHLARGWGVAQWPSRPGQVVAFEGGALLPPDRIHAMARCRDGTLWIGSGTLLQVNDSRLREVGGRDGMPGHLVLALLEDSNGNLWIGTAAGGLVRLDRSGFSSWGSEDGLTTEKVGALVDDHLGGVLVVGFPACTTVHRLDGERFTPFAFPLPDAVTSCGWGESQVTLLDRGGEWWVPTAQGLVRYPPVARLEELAGIAPKAFYTSAEGLRGEAMFRLFEDARGDIWAGVFGMSVRLVRFDRASETFRSYGAGEGLPVDAASAFTEGPDGSLWIGFYGSGLGEVGGGVARYRDGRFRYFAPSEDGLPHGFVSSLLVDGHGRLWVGILGAGVTRLDAPDSDPPDWVRLDTRNGLASDAVHALAEDRLQRIYIGTTSGVDRLDPTSGRVRHFDIGSGLANNAVVSARVDGVGDLWVATAGGVSRMRPRPEPAEVAPAVLLIEVRAAGNLLPLPERGAEELAGLDFPPSLRNLDVAFAAADLRPTREFAYQHRFGDGEWSPSSRERRVHLAGLSSGRYRFEVRAALPDGTVGQPATLEFTIAPPLWRRWWFLLGAAMAIAGAAYAVHRQRLARLRELYQVRSRIASDLHDELGLSLSRVAILAEVARPGLEPGGRASAALEEIATSARDLIDATSDMAWALDPRKDDLPSLLARLRRMAGDVCEGAGVEWTFTAPGEVDRVVVKAERRRHLYLILKEAIHNSVRHGKPSRVSLTVALNDGHLAVEVVDDGCGFDLPELRSSGGVGHGLSSMVRRAVELGGTLDLASQPGAGTRVRLEVPLG